MAAQGSEEEGRGPLKKGRRRLQHLSWKPWTWWDRGPRDKSLRFSARPHLTITSTTRTRAGREEPQVAAPSAITWRVMHNTGAVAAESLAVIVTATTLAATAIGKRKRGI